MYQLEPFKFQGSLVAEFPKVFCDLSVTQNQYLDVSLTFSVQDPENQIQFVENDVFFEENVFQKSVLTNRRHEIWKATCFEAFLKLPKSTDYLEFNFNPGGAWNCYQFMDCRIPHPPQEVSSVVSVSYGFAFETSTFTFDIRIDVSKLKPFRQISNLEIGLTSILAMKDKSKKYLALRHTSDRPDFHKFDSFIIIKPLNKKSE